jgi:hypothetical protein
VRKKNRGWRKRKGERVGPKATSRHGEELSERRRDTSVDEQERD